MLLSPTAFAAKAGFEKGGDVIPPYGATGDPGGTKLTGVMYVHYFDYQYFAPDYIAYGGAKFSLRLQREKSSYSDGLLWEIPDPLDFSDPGSIISDTL